MVYCDLHGRIGDDSISSDDVALNSRCQKDAVSISRDLVIFYRIVRIGCGYKTDSKIVSLSCKSIPACPVLTEPVVARACRQSYAAARISSVTIPNRNVAIDFIEG